MSQETQQKPTKNVFSLAEAVKLASANMPLPVIEVKKTQKKVEKDFRAVVRNAVIMEQTKVSSQVIKDTLAYIAQLEQALLKAAPANESEQMQKWLANNKQQLLSVTSTSADDVDRVAYVIALIITKAYSYCVELELWLKVQGYTVDFNPAHDLMTLIAAKLPSEVRATMGSRLAAGLDQLNKSNANLAAVFQETINRVEVDGVMVSKLQLEDVIKARILEAENKKSASKVEGKPVADPNATVAGNDGSTSQTDKIGVDSVDSNKSSSDSKAKADEKASKDDSKQKVTKAKTKRSKTN